MHFVLFDRLELYTGKKFALVHKSAKKLAKFNFQSSLIFTNLMLILLNCIKRRLISNITHAFKDNGSTLKGN